MGRNNDTTPCLPAMTATCCAQPPGVEPAAVKTQRTAETEPHTDAKRPLLKAESWADADVPTQTPRENNFGNEQAKPTHTGKTLRHTTNYGRIAHVS